MSYRASVGLFVLGFGLAVTTARSTEAQLFQPAFVGPSGLIGTEAEVTKADSAAAVVPDNRSTWLPVDPRLLAKDKQPWMARFADGIQVTAQGLRLQADWSGRRVGLTPEFSTQNEFSLGGVFASTLPRGAAGLVFNLGPEKREFLGSIAWQLSPAGRMRVTGGQLRQHVTMPFETGPQNVALRQYAGGIDYQIATGARLVERLDLNIHASRSASRDLGHSLAFRETASEYSLTQIPLRVAGGSIVGFEARGVVRPVSSATLGLTLGGQRLAYDLSAGRDSTSRITSAAEWTQQLGNGYRVTAGGSSYAAHRTFTASAMRTSERQQFGLTLSSLRGRDGVAHDTQLRWTHTLSWGHASVGPGTLGRSSEEFRTYEGREMLDLVSMRPAFIPAQVVARIDTTVAATPLVVVSREGLPTGARVDTATAAVTLTDPVATILLVTRNGVPVENTGQFVVSNNRLEVRPGAMTPPQPGLVDEYTVTLENVAGGVTAVAVTVSTGSIRIDRITVTTDARRDAPDTLNFESQGGVPLNTLLTSNAVRITGINVPVPITVAGGEYALDGGAFTTAPGSVLNGQTVRVRHGSASTPGTTTTTVLTVGGTVAHFSSGTLTVTTADEPGVQPEPGPIAPPPDTTPGAFSFAAQTGVALSTTITSNAITVSSIDAAAAIVVSGGEYAINGGAYTAAAGTVANGQTVTVRQTSSASYSTTTIATVTIGGVSGTFSVTTRAADTTPDAFSFTPQTNVEPNTATVSNAITVSGIDAAAISVSGGEYAINGGAYTTAAGTIANGQTVTVRQTSSASYATTTIATLMIDGVSGTFSVTTRGADTTPDAFSFTAQTNVEPNTATVSNAITVSGIDAAAISVSGGEYAINGGAYTSAAGTVANGQTVTARQTSSASYSTTTIATLTIGGVSGTFSVTTRGADTMPDAFSFASQTNVPQDTLIVSNSITVSGIEAATAISVGGGGEYAVNGGSYTSSAGTVLNGQTITVRQRSAQQSSTTSAVTLTIGGMSGAFSVTTTASDTTPDAFSFTSQSSVPLSSTIVSNTITISGITSASPVSISGGEFAIQGNNYVTSGTITNGQTIKVRVTSSSSFSTTTTATLTIGGVGGTFSVTTEAMDTTPDAFSFTPETNVNLNQTRTSNSITVSGINSPASISVSGASSSEYRVNNGAWTSTPGTVVSGDSVRVRHTSAPTNLTVTTTTLTIGGVSASFTTTTRP